MREKKRNPGNQDEKEKARKLTPEEERRLRAFEDMADAMCAQGYRRTELTVGIVRANLFAVLLLIPLMILGIGLFFLKNREPGGEFGPLTPVWFFLVLLVLIVVHELIHGLSWALLPMIAGILAGSFPVLLMGIIMADAAAGDILIVWKILRYKSTAEHIVYIDHPTQAGGVIFEK